MRGPALESRSAEESFALRKPQPASMAAQRFASFLRRQGFWPSEHFVERFLLRASHIKFDPRTFREEFYRARHYRQTRPGYNTRIALMRGMPVVYRISGWQGERILLITILPQLTPMGTGTLPPVVPARPPDQETEGEQEQSGPVSTISSADSTLVNNVVPAHACRVRRNPYGALHVRPASAITHVVIHTLQGNYANAIQQWQGEASCYKPHYVISRRGEITQIVAERHVPQHANAANGYSIGIEHDGFAIDPGSYTEEVYLASAALTRDICRRNNIPADSAHIIGHDDAPGTGHGDPGGFWDWDYYLSLVQWDGRDPALKPVRLVVDYTSHDFWPTSDDWQEFQTRRSRPDPDKNKRGCSRQETPCPEHGYGPRCYRARPSANADAPAVYFAEIPLTGRYEVSAWWPVLPGNNSETRISVIVNGANTPVISAQVNQSTRRGRTRSTRALPATPIWFSLGALQLRAGETVQVNVSRLSSKPGWIIADAIRLLKR